MMMTMVSAADEGQADDLTDLLRKELMEAKLPSFSAAVMRGNQLVAEGAVGVRKLGEPDKVGPEDRYHLGSCTKPMTATLVAILVEEGTLSWTSTVGEVLGDAVPDLHKGYQGVTVEQLLAHVGGLPGNPPKSLWLQAWVHQGKQTPREQRLAFVKGLLKLKPSYRPGKKTVYSNQGYATIGVMLEVLTDTAWETLILEKLFTPLGMASAGFRAPLGKQPWGHHGKEPLAPEPKGDNPSAIAPAGAVHASLADWGKFIGFHLSQTTAEGGKLLKNEASFEKLHSVLPKSKGHAVGGWLHLDRPEFGGHCMQMAGSNTAWFCLYWMLPKKNVAYLVATNSGARNAFPACDSVIGELMKQYP